MTTSTKKKLALKSGFGTFDFSLKNEKFFDKFSFNINKDDM